MSKQEKVAHATPRTCCMPVLLSGESKKTLSRDDSIITSRTKALTSRTRKEGPNPRLNTFRSDQI